MQFVRVLVPLRLDWIPVYRTELPLRRGQSVGVRLSGREYAGLVWESAATPDIDASRILPVTEVLEDLPEVGAEEMEFWKFLSEYYLCSLNEVYKAARPAQMLRSMQAEALRRRKTEARKLAENEALRSRIASAQQRLQALEARIAAPRRSEAVAARLAGQKERLLRQLDTLKKRLGETQPDSQAAPSPVQKEFPDKPTLIMGDRRGEYYLDAALKALKRGMQVLILTPETAFCKRLEAFLEPHLNGKMQSAVSAAQRGRTAAALLRGESLAVIGTKAAIFLPFTRLALVVIDEEQDSFYKQNDSAPRYNGRDAALKLAEIHGAEVLLGSSFPSLEARYNCAGGKFRLCNAPARSGKLSVVDIGAEKRKNGMTGYFSRKLVSAVLGCSGPAVLLRGWEKPEELTRQCAALFPGLDVRVMTLTELKREGCPGAALIAVIQADALVSDDDFRSDERALQLVAMLRGLAPEVLVQTSVRERFDGSKTAESLMRERREFSFPPYTRLVEVRRENDGETLERHFLKRGPELSGQKRQILENLPQGTYPDVDPA